MVLSAIRAFNGTTDHFGTSDISTLARSTPHSLRMLTGNALAISAVPEVCPGPQNGQAEGVRRVASAKGDCRVATFRAKGRIADFLRLKIVRLDRGQLLWP